MQIIIIYMIITVLRNVYPVHMQIKISASHVLIQGVSNALNSQNVAIVCLLLRLRITNLAKNVSMVIFMM